VLILPYADPQFALVWNWVPLQRLARARVIRKRVAFTGIAKFTGSGACSASAKVCLGMTSMCRGCDIVLFPGVW
jgi:hypothetical protein